MPRLLLTTFSKLADAGTHFCFTPHMFFGTCSTAIHRCVDGQSECTRRGRLRSEPSEGTVDSDPVVDRKGPPDEPKKKNFVAQVTRRPMHWQSQWRERRLRQYYRAKVRAHWRSSSSCFTFCSIDKFSEPITSANLSLRWSFFVRSSHGVISYMKLP